MKPWFGYILFCDQKTFYVGLTHNLSQRLNSRISGYNIATKKFSDITLQYTERHDTRFSAEKREKQLNGWSVAKKKALITGNLDKLKQLSKSHEHVDGLR